MSIRRPLLVHLAAPVVVAAALLTAAVAVLRAPRSRAAEPMGAPAGRSAA